MEKRLPASREVEDSKAVPPLEEGDSSEVVIGQAEELTEHELALIEQGQKLLKIASRAAKVDRLDREAQVVEGIKVTLPVIISTTLYNFLGTEGLPLDINLPIMLSAGGVTLVDLLKSHNHNTSLSLPEGNTIQCLRIAQHTETVRDGKVLLAVHSRRLGTGEDVATRHVVIWQML